MLSVLDNNTYYLAKDITVYPASNSVDSGKLASELNLRNTTINITNINYVVSPSDGYDLSITADKKVLIKAGKAILNGFEVNTKADIEYELPTTDKLYTGTTYPEYEGYALLCLHTLFDEQSNLSGNIQVGSQWIFSGIQVLYVTAEEYKKTPNEYLILGGINTDGSSVKQNDNKFGRIDLKNINLKLNDREIQSEADKIYNVPSAKYVDLDNFLNKDLRHYWLSKSGDYEYGSLIFAKRPTNYSEPDFEESILDQNQWGVKIFADDDNAGKILVSNTTTRSSSNISIEGNGLNFNNYDGGTGSTSSILHNTNGLDFNSNSYRFSVNEDIHFIFNDDALFASNGNTKNLYFNTLFSSEDGKISTSYYVNGVNQGTIVLYSYNKDVINDYHTNIHLENTEEICNLSLKDTSVSDTWKNVLHITDNIETTNTWSKGYIVAGTKKYSNGTSLIDIGEDPSSIDIPTGRKIQSGDIYATQVWSAVYNDICEIFDLSDNIDIRKEIIGLVVAQDSKNLNKYTIANKNNKNIIGIISENPGFCTGGADCKNGVPVALSGRVKVRYDGKVKPGDFVGLSKHNPGYVSKCWHFSKYRCGKVLQVLDKDFIEVLVLL